MQQDRYDELQERAFARTVEELEGLAQARLQLDARQAVNSELEAMRSEDKILILSDEEERILRCFRAFKARSKPGAVFKWQTHPESGVVPAPEQSLIADPQEVP